MTTPSGKMAAARTISTIEFQILPDDLIYVTESPLLGTRNIFSLIGSVFGLANQAGNL